MNMTVRTILRLALLLAVAGTLSACDDSSQNIGWEPGDSLAIIGPAEEVAVPGTYEYYVQAFTIDKDYTWSVNGPVEPSYEVRREGEFVDVTYEEPGTYTIDITDQSDDGYQGSLEVNAVLVDVLTQAGRLYPSLAAAVDEADLVDALDEASDITVFAPSEAAFEPVLESLDGELPAPGVLADILTYHVAGSEEPASAISDGDEVATLYGDNYPLSLGVSGGTVSVNGVANSATVTAADVPVSGDVALHEIDTVLLPPTASVDIADQAVVVEDDVTTATVAGVYVPADGGFVAIEDADGNVLGTSDVIDGGIVNGVTVELDSAVDAGTDVSAVVYADVDMPYERDGEPVSDDATLSPAE